MSFSDGGKPEPDWEDPSGNQAYRHCLGRLLAAAAVIILILIAIFMVSWIRYFQIRQGGL